MEIREYKTYNEPEILRLYSGVGWTAYTDHPEVLRKGFENSMLTLAAVLYFLRKGGKLYFYSLGTICEENMRVSRGAQLLGSGFPIGARAALLAHDFPLESLVCYTFCDR